MTRAILDRAVAAAKRLDSVWLVASTTGRSAEEAFQVAHHAGVRLVIVTFDEKQMPEGLQFPLSLRKKIEASGHQVLSYRRKMRIPLKWFRLFSKICGSEKWYSLGIGSRVCFRIVRLALRARLVREGDTVVALAGKEKGLDTALILGVQSQTRRIILKQILSVPPSYKEK